MARRPRDVTDAELDVLQALWDRGDATVRELADALYPGGGPGGQATVQKLLERLEDKGAVVRKSSARPSVFAASLSRAGLVARRLRATADELCEGSLTPLLTHLVSAGRLSPREIAELRRLVDSLARKG